MTAREAALPSWAEGASNAEVGDYSGSPVVKLTIPISPELFAGLRLKSNPVRFWIERHGDELIPTFEVQPEVAELRDALAWHLDDDACSFDHHGGCQTHDPNEGETECHVRQHRRLLGWEAV